MRMRCGMGGDMGGKRIQGFGGETRRKETAMKTYAQNNTLPQLVTMANESLPRQRGTSKTLKNEVPLLGH